MKRLSVTSFLCGTAIILAPILHDMFSLALVAHLLAIDPKGDVHLRGGLNSSYQSWCLFIGICLFVVGVVSALSSRRTRSEVRMADGIAHSLAASDA